MTGTSPNRLRKAPSRFTTVPNALLRDAELSLKAKGLYCLMYSKPDGWTFYESALVDESRDGKDAVSAGLLELVTRGWLKRDRSKTETGKFAAYEYEICTELNQGGLSAPEKPQRENRSGKPSSINTEKENTETDTPLPPTGVSGGVWDDDSQFMELLSAYALLNPDRADARKAWDVWVAKGLKPSFGLIMRALPSFAQRQRWKKDDRRYVPALSKWLGEEEWRQVAAGIPTAAELKEQADITKDGMAAYHRVEWDKKRGKASSEADLKAVRLWQEQQARLSQKTKESVE